jgi:hypothetical protein
MDMGRILHVNVPMPMTGRTMTAEVAKLVTVFSRVRLAVKFVCVESEIPTPMPLALGTRNLVPRNRLRRVHERVIRERTFVIRSKIIAHGHTRAQNIFYLTETEGFEPTEVFTPRRFSKPLP